MVDRLVGFIFGYRRSFIFLLQVALTLISMWAAYALRFEATLSEHILSLAILSFLALVIKLPLYSHFNLYQGWWRYTSVQDLVVILKASALSGVLLLSIAVLFVSDYSRGAVIIDFGLTLLLMGGIRILTRIIREDRNKTASATSDNKAKRTLIVGAGVAGLGLLRHLQHNPLPLNEVVGLADDDLTKENMNFFGVPVLGSLSKLTDLIANHQIEEVFIAIPSLPRAKLRQLVDICIRIGIQFRMVPSLRDILSYGSSYRSLRSVRVEDLLGREPIRLDKTKVLSDVKDQVVLVTGAGGSIGSELCRQILKLGPKRLILVERSEANLFYIDRELRDQLPTMKDRIVPIIADILHESLMDEMFSLHRPSVVYHAAAYKHVPLMEDHPHQAVRNNVQGTLQLVENCIRHGIRKFVNISTDKAVNPKSIMGYSKRLAELVVQSRAGKGCELISVRFGNVLGSSGSVVEIFRKQIEAGGPLTVTDPEATRYFMTTPEAVELVLHAGAHGSSGEIYMLDMGQPVKILDLAETMIRLADPEGRKGLEVEFIGLRKGEKMAEELIWEGEDFVPSIVEKVFRFRRRLMVKNLDEALKSLFREDQDVARELRQIVQSLDAQPLPASSLGPVESRMAEGDSVSATL